MLRFINQYGSLILGEGRGRTGNYMPSDGMRVDIGAVKFEIYPIKTKSLQQPQHRLPKESIQTKRSSILINNRHNRITKHERHKSIRAFNFMFYISCWVEFKDSFYPFAKAFVEEFGGADEKNYEHSAAQVDENGDPDYGQPVGHRDVDAGYPKSGGDEG